MNNCSNCGEEITAGLERNCNYCGQKVCTKCRLPESHECPGVATGATDISGGTSVISETLNRIRGGDYDSVDVDRVIRQTSDRESDYSGPDLNPDGTIARNNPQSAEDTIKNGGWGRYLAWVPNQITLALWSRKITRLLGIALLAVAAYNIGTMYILATPAVIEHRLFAASVLDPSLNTSAVMWIADFGLAAIGLIVYMWR